MTGVTIDHLASLVVLVSVLLGSIVAYSQIMGAAVKYQQNHQVAMKAAELANALLSPGNPNNWGQNNSVPLSFGLQDPEAGGYSLSPFSLQRLMSSQSQVYYSKTDMWYSNSSLGRGGYLLVPVNNAVNYTTAAKLLGVNGSYGFLISIMPTLNVSVSEVNLNPLRFKVEVRGPGFALAGATLRYLLYRAVQNGADYPLIEVLSGDSQTNSSGLASLEFPTIDGSQFAYSFIVYARLSGLVGIGYYSHVTITENKFIVPIIQNFEQGQVLLAHNWDINPQGGGSAALHYNATFLVLTESLELNQLQIANSTGIVNYGEGQPYQQVQIPANATTGILLVAFRKGNEYGIVMMPWGISALGFSVAFGGDPRSTDWVAIELRQVTVNKISYQVKVAVWSTQGYQSWGYHP
jgi:hypothetical protein